MKAENGYLIFTTGKRVYCHWETVGIKLGDDEEDGGINLAYGADGGIHTHKDAHILSKETLSPEECQELADAMIARWQEFKERYK